MLELDDKTSDEDQRIDEDEQQELNEELYDRLMESIDKTWRSFDIDNGRTDLKAFKKIMVNVARDQGLY